MDTRPSIKKVVLSGIGIILLLVLLSWFWHYLHTGKIIITTNNPYKTITLTKLDSKTGTGSSSSKTFTAQSKLSVDVSTGQYIASVEGGSQAATQVISLKSRQTLRYEIDPINTSGVEPVVYQNASNVAASGNELLYTDVPSGHLYEVDAQNNISVLNATIAFQTIKWASPSYGVGQDANGHLYTIINGLVSPLKVPFSYGGNTIGFDVSSSKQIYVSYGAVVYNGDSNGAFKEIYTANASNLVLAAGINKVALADETGGQNTGASKPLLAVVDLSGKVTKSYGEGKIRKLAWSPNGHYLITVNESYADVYDSKLHRVVQLPSSSSVGQVAWLDNNKVLYASNDELWSYDLSNQKAALVANMPLANYITSLTTSSDKSYVYVTTYDFKSSYAIRRIGLRGQQVSPVVYQLQDILPLVLSDCSLGLVNFAQPATVLVKSFPDSDLSSQAYLQEAQDRLSQNGFDVSKLQLKVVPGN